MITDEEAEKRRAYQRAWHHKNKSKRLAANKAYRQRNAEEIAAKSKARYYADLPKSRERVRESAQRQRSLQLEPAGLVQWQRRLGGRSRGAMTKGAHGGGRQMFAESFTYHAQLHVASHEEWLESIDLMRMAERAG